MKDMSTTSQSTDANAESDDQAFGDFDMTSLLQKATAAKRSKTASTNQSQQLRDAFRETDMFSGEKKDKLRTGTEDKKQIPLEDENAKLQETHRLGDNRVDFTANAKPSLSGKSLRQLADETPSQQDFELDEYKLTDLFSTDDTFAKYAKSDAEATEGLYTTYTASELELVKKKIAAEPHSFLRKILKTMQPLNQFVYYSQIEKFGKPKDFKQLLTCMCELRARVTTIPKLMRNAVYLCIFTKYTDIAEAKGMKVNNLYREFYNNIDSIDNCRVFLDDLQTSIQKETKQQKSNIPMKYREEVQFSIRCVIHFLASVSK